MNYFDLIPIELVSIILIYLEDGFRYKIERTYKIFEDIVNSELFQINRAIFKYKDYYKYMKYLKSNNIQKFSDIEYKTSEFIFHFENGTLRNNYRYSIELNVNIDRNFFSKSLIYNDMKDFEKIFKDNKGSDISRLQIKLTEYGHIVKFKSDPIFRGISISEHEFFILILKFYLIGIDVSYLKKFD